MKNSYSSVSNFGSNQYTPLDNPLTYCIGNNLEQHFLHGGNQSNIGNNSKNCQLFMSDYCAAGWDKFCEFESKNKTKTFATDKYSCAKDSTCSNTAGNLLIANTAARKYLLNMHNAREQYEPFDPTVANSPMIRYWVSENGGGIPEYAVDPKSIDQDVLMDKILEDPNIAFSILINIYNTMKRHGTLSSLKTTKIGNFYNSHPFFKEKGGV